MPLCSSIFNLQSSMASITSFNRLQLKNLNETRQKFSSSLNFPKSHVNFTDFANNKAEKRLLIPSVQKDFDKARSKVIARVEVNDEWGSEKDTASSTGVAVEEEPPKVDTEIENLKRQLVYTLNGTNRGLSASSETRAEIIELITKLEAKNSTPAPMEALTLFDGKWILAYTSFIGLFPLLSRGVLPLVKVEEISQRIDSTNFTVQNVVVFSGPLATTSISTNAKFEVRSPKRVQIKFVEGIIGTPQLTDSIELPESVEFLGQKIDLSPFKGLLTSIQGTASSVARSISSQPPLKFPISSTKAESWLLTTYLDEDLRISRGDGGSIFVLIKAFSSLLTT